MMRAAYSKALVCIGLLFNVCSFGLLAETKANCKKLADFGKIIDDESARAVQSFKLFFCYMHQFGHVDGKDRLGRHFEDSMDETRRFWLGMSSTFAEHWRLRVVSQMSDDRHNYPGEKREWGHETFRNFNLSFDAGKAWGVSFVDDLELGYGRRSGRMLDEWQRSAFLNNALERSSFSNKLWPADRENGNPLAAWLKWRRGRHTFTTAIFSGTYDDYIGGWEDSSLYYGSWLGDFSEKSRFDKQQYWISLYYQDVDAGEDSLAKGNTSALALVHRIAKGSWMIHSSFGLGDNGRQSSFDKEGSFKGVVVMPMVWLLEERLKLVIRYQHQRASRDKGIVLNSRYARVAEARDSEQIDINGGRGDKHHGAYLGFNYYFCDENLKLMTALQHDRLSSGGQMVYQGWTLGSSLRVWF